MEVSQKKDIFPTLTDTPQGLAHYNPRKKITLQWQIFPQGLGCQILAMTLFLLHFGCLTQDDYFLPFEDFQHLQPNSIALKLLNLEPPIVHEQIIIYQHHPHSQHLTQSCISKWNKVDENSPLCFEETTQEN